VAGYRQGCQPGTATSSYSSNGGGLDYGRYEYRGRRGPLLQHYGEGRGFGFGGISPDNADTTANVSVENFVTDTIANGVGNFGNATTSVGTGGATGYQYGISYRASAASGPVGQFNMGARYGSTPALSHYDVPQFGRGGGVAGWGAAAYEQSMTAYLQFNGGGSWPQVQYSRRLALHHRDWQ
jgi:hypothetical protein